MKEKEQGKSSFTKIGIVLGIIVVILSVVWVTIINLCHDDPGANDITWVG